jgi:hypothetical protein
MDLKLIEHFQQENNKIEVPTVDGNYILLNRGIKFLLNFLLIYLFLTFIIYNYPSMSINIFILLICMISSVIFYILDLNFPACYI